MGTTTKLSINIYRAFGKMEAEYDEVKRKQRQNSHREKHSRHSIQSNKGISLVFNPFKANVQVKRLASKKRLPVLIEEFLFPRFYSFALCFFPTLYTF